MTDLIVELYGTEIGLLRGERDDFDFHPGPLGMARFGVGATTLSVAVPLLTSVRPAQRVMRRNFFEEVLAEGGIRAQLASRARLDNDNTMALLARYGRDVAGALQIWDPTDPYEPRAPHTEPVTDERIREMFDEVAASPLGNNSIRRLSSLAGVQDKVLLARVEGQWVEPLDGYPSTHILKPLSGKYRTLIFDEEYGSRFARALGLAAFDTEVVAFDDRQALVIERYDRDVDGTRVHQEDFNQALGYRGDQKYELVPDGRLRAIAGVLREHSSQRERQRLLQMVTLSAALGNLDMHAKNISVLHEPGGEMRLAPMYDVVPQLHMDGIDQTLALYIANTNDPHLVCGGDLLAEGESWGLRAPRAIVTDALEQIHAVAEQEIPHPGAEQSMPQTIADRTARLLNSLERITPPVPLPPADRPFTPRTAGGGWGGPAQR